MIKDEFKSIEDSVPWHVLSVLIMSFNLFLFGTENIIRVSIGLISFLMLFWSLWNIFIFYWIKIELYLKRKNRENKT